MRRQRQEFARRLGLAPILVLVSIFAASPVLGDGNEFFQSVHTGVKQLVYVGNVRDEHGKLIKGAVVSWRAAADDGSGQTVGYDTYTDALGHYRTIDISLIMASMDYSFDPKRVELSASLPGYRLLRRFRHTPDSQRFGSIEMDFVIAPRTWIAPPTLMQRWKAITARLAAWPTWK